MIVGIAGRKGCGKDTLGKMIVDQRGYTQAAFADKLREEVCEIYGCDVQLLLQRHTKESPMEIFGGKSPRQVMQDHGTLRRKENPDYWVEALSERILASPGESFVITDVRFPNEKYMIEEMRGIVIKIVRESWKMFTDVHESETALDGHTFDHVVYNKEHYPQGMLVQGQRCLPPVMT